MLLLNFAHPLTGQHLDQLAALLRERDDGADTGADAATSPITVRDVPTQADLAQPFAPQAADLADRACLSPDQWQTERILVNPPSYSFLAAALLSELHGRIGYFPSVLRLRPVVGSLPSRFEVAEVIHLQAIRDAARQRR